MTATDSSLATDEQLRKRLVELTRDLILIPSTADRPDEIDRCMEFVINHVENAGAVTVHRYREGNAPACVLLPHAIAAPKVLLLAHLDIVSLPDSAPYRSVVRDERIYGPGAGDMKGELAILLEVFRALHDRCPGGSVGLAVTSDEERGGAHGTRFLFEDAGLRCGTAIVPDSGAVNEIAVEEKGALHLRIRVDGKAGHGSRPWLADNPLDRMLTAQNKIRARFDTLKSGRDHWHPTCTFTFIHTPNQVANRIAVSAEVVCDIRFPFPFTVEQMLSAVRDCLDENMRLEPIVAAEPTVLDPDPLYLAVTEELTGKPVKLIREHGGSDARFIAKYGIPVIMTRPLVGNLHTYDEWIDIPTMEILYRIYETYLLRKLGMS
jgi:succinyl-diaminopimelate desuccinylase